MGLQELIFRSYVALTHFTPKVFTPEEKKELIPKMIETNRGQDNDVTHADARFLKDLEIEKIVLPHCAAWLLKKAGNPQDKIIYYIHGGGFTGASTKERMRFVSTLLNRFHFNVFSIDYRLAPEFMQPCALLDCLDGYAYLLKRFAGKDIVYVGESAGGNLAIVLAMYVRDHGLIPPRAIYANSAPAQFAEVTESYTRFSLKTDFVVTTSIIANIEGIYFEKKNAEDPYVSPLFGDLRNLPPITLSVSQCECLFDDSLMLYGKLKADGNKATLLSYPGLWHAFIMSPQKRRIVKESYPDFGRFLTANLS